MKTVINDGKSRRMCDTEHAAVVAQRTVGAFGDETGFEERLYRNRRGYHFLWGIGGNQSPYPVEAIREVSKDRVENIRNGNWD